MLNTLKERAKAQEAEKRTRAELGEPVPLQVIPPPIPSPEAKPQQAPLVLTFAGEEEATSDMHNTRGQSSQSGHVHTMREENIPRSPNDTDLEDEDDDIVVVSSSASKRRTRASVVALEKKKENLGLGGESVEPDVTIDLEEIEKKAAEKERRRKGKGSAEEKNTESVSKKRKGIEISEPKSTWTNDNFVIDNADESSEDEKRDMGVPRAN
ncbi:hypothetical protein LIER_26889 [Lithospermum erythrorhizon]|uniref:Uncharacterized protein n=1 Tax=Lithospermum erythrorhizon TaxID=34254 RepID=A0AAV3RA93_LITER